MPNSGMITFTHKGDFSKTFKAWQKMLGLFHTNIFDKYGRRGVEALASYTPKDTGRTSAAWGYEVIQTDSYVTINWYNTNINKGVNIAIILQYGHGTGTGGWVEGRDYINPAIQPIFDQILNEIWKEVTSA